MEYSKEVKSLLGDSKSYITPTIEDQKTLLNDFDCLLSATQPTGHAELVSFQKGLVTIQSVENDPAYWEVMSSTLAVGWLNSWLGSYVLSLNSSIRATPVMIKSYSSKDIDVVRKEWADLIQEYACRCDW